MKFATVWLTSPSYSTKQFSQNLINMAQVSNSAIPIPPAKISFLSRLTFFSNHKHLKFLGDFIPGQWPTSDGLLPYKFYAEQILHLWFLTLWNRTLELGVLTATRPMVWMVPNTIDPVSVIPRMRKRSSGPSNMYDHCLCSQIYCLFKLKYMAISLEAKSTLGKFI